MFTRREVSRKYIGIGIPRLYLGRMLMLRIGDAEYFTGAEMMADGRYLLHDTNVSASSGGRHVAVTCERERRQILRLTLFLASRSSLDVRAVARVLDQLNAWGIRGMIELDDGPTIGSLPVASRPSGFLEYPVSVGDAPAPRWKRFLRALLLLAVIPPSAVAIVLTSAALPLPMVVTTSGALIVTLVWAKLAERGINRLFLGAHAVSDSVR